MKPEDIGKLMLSEIRDLLILDGYGSDHSIQTLMDIRKAARIGCLLWTAERITTTDGSRLDLRPEWRGEMEELAQRGLLSKGRS